MDTVKKYARELVPGEILVIYMRDGPTVYAVISVIDKDNTREMICYGRAMIRNTCILHNWVLNPHASFDAIV